MVPSARRLATLLSLLVPGAGHAYLRAWRRSGALLAVTAVVVGLFLGIATSMSLGGSFLALLLVANVALLAIRVFAVADVARGFGGVALATLAGLVAAPHVALAYVGVRGYGVLDEVFADAEPTDVLAHDGVFLSITTPLPRYVAPDTWTFGLSEQLGPAELKPVQGSTEVLVAEEPAERPWTTILLLGTDEGPGNWGARTDTIILAAIQHGTGRAAAFGIPRNLAQVPLGPKRTPFKQPLNALYAAKGGGAAGASAVKQAVSTLLGVRVDYYALVNLRGFADLVDALGGVRIRVKERLVDEVTRPAWGEPKPKIDVRPGEVRRFYGREALAYVRSRKDSSDYTRMARQRCFLSALANQIDPVRVLRSFGSLARTVETSVSTDVPLSRLPALVRLVAGVDPRQTLTITFGPSYFFARRKDDNHPVPHEGKIQRTVRRAVLEPETFASAARPATAAATC